MNEKYDEVIDRMFSSYLQALISIRELQDSFDTIEEDGDAEKVLQGFFDELDKTRLPWYKEIGNLEAIAFIS